MPKFTTDRSPPRRGIDRLRYVALPGLAVLFLSTGCASGLGLRPSEPDQLHPERDGAARAHAADVSLVAEFDRWEGSPDPTDAFTAVLVEIENTSHRPLRIRYDQFGLRTGDRSLSPRDPRGIEGTERASRRGYHGGRTLTSLDYSGFRLAPHHSLLGRFHGTGLGRRSHLSSFGHGFGHGVHGLGFGHGRRSGGHRLFGGHGFHRYGGYSHFRRVELPTRDMLATAVPEGTLEPGGRVRGYLFFAHLEDDVPEATLHAVLEDEDGERLGAMELPFRTRKEPGTPR